MKYLALIAALQITSGIAILGLHAGLVNQINRDFATATPGCVV